MEWWLWDCRILKVLWSCAGGYPADRQKIFDFFISRPDLETPVEIAKAEHRELAFKQLKALVNEASIHPMKLLMEDPARYFTITEAIGFIDVSLGVKLGVQFRWSNDSFEAFPDDVNNITRFGPEQFHPAAAEADSFYICECFSVCGEAPSLI